MREEALSEIEERTQEALTQIEDAASAGMTGVKNTETAAMQERKKTTICRLSYFNKRKAKFLQETKRTKIAFLSDMNRKRKSKLQGIKTTSIGESAVKKKKTEALHEIKVATTSWLSNVNKTKTDGVKELNATTSSGLSDLNRKTTEAMQEIDKANTNIVEEVIYKRQQKEVKRAKLSAGVTDVDNTKTEAMHKMKRAKITALPDMGGKGKRTLQGIKTTASIGESAVKKKKTDALHEIKVATTSWLSNVNKTKTDGVNELNATTSSGLSDLNRKTTEAMQEIDKANTNIVEEVIFKRQQKEVKRAKLSAGVTDVDNTKTEAMHKMKRAKITALPDMGEKGKRTLQGIKTTASIGESAVKKKKTDALHEIKVATTSGLSNVNKTKADGVNELNATTSSGLSDLNRKTTEAMQEIDKANTNIVEEVIYKRQQKEVKRAKLSAGVTDVDNTKTEAMHKMKRAKITALPDMGGKGKRTLQGIKTTASIGESAVKKKKTDALHEIKVATTSGLSNVNKTKTDGVNELNATTSSGLSDLNRKTTEAMQEIDKANTNIVEEVIFKRQQKEVKREKLSAGVTDVDNTKTEAMHKMKRAKITALPDMGGKGKRTLQGIKTTASIGESAVKKKKTDALHEIKVATTSGLSNVNKTKADGVNELNATTSSGLSDLNRKTTEAMQEIDKANTNIVEEVIFKRQQKEVKRAKLSAGVTDVDNTKTEAMHKMKRAKITALPDMGGKGKKTLQGIKTTASIGESAVKKKKTGALHEIKVATTSGLSNVNKTKADGVNELNATTSSGLSDLNRKTTEAMQEIDKANTNIVEEVIFKRQQKEVKRAKLSAGVTDVDNTKTEAMHKMKRAKITALPDMGGKGKRTLQGIKTTASIGESAVKKKKTDALHEIKVATTSGLSNVNKTKADGVNELNATTSSGLSDLNRKTTEAMQEIDKANTNIVEEVIYKRQQKEIFKLDGRQPTSSQNEHSSTVISEPLSAQVKTPILGEDEPYLKMKTVAGDTRYDESDIQQYKKAINKAWGKFIDYMEPDPILDCAIEIDLFGYRETRDIKEEKNTTEKNRRILEKVRSKGNTGYEKFKDCLHKTDQSILVKLLESIEREEDTSSLLQQIKEKKTQETMKETLSAQVKTPVLEEDEAYLKMKTKLQDDLIESYRQEHATILLAPLAAEKYTPLLPFYVMPDIQTIKIKRSPGVGEEERTLVKPFRNVFYSGNNVLRQIYLTADAGLGKSAFCKRLALTWCQAKKPIKDEKRYFSQEEIEALAEFDFIFLLMLRDSSKECDIDDMILKQLVPKLANTDDLKRDDLKKFTNKESCLVILDGLDEWTHSSTKSCKPQHGQIPHAKARQWTVLTTTRPWKLSLSGLSSCQIDQRLEITGLSRESADKLKRSVIAHLYGGEDENKLEQYVNDFNRAAQGKHVSDLEAVPLLLMYMLFLRHDNIELGESLCELYSNIIELLLSRTVETCEDRPPKSEHTQDKIPQCLRENELCPQFYTILTDLGHLAFQTLFKETRDENTLVFASSVAKQYLNEQCLKFCLKTGMITESKIQGKLSKQESKVSFAHKTIQEFFAALYICSIPDQTSVPKTVLSKCTCVKDILEMSKILIFLSGFDVNVSSSISRELMKIINEDEITREYRSSLQDKREPLKQFQDMCVSCCKELPHDNDVNFCLQDVFIDQSCQQEQYHENLKQLTSRNKQNIRSLCIICIGGMSRTPYSSVIEYFALSDLENIEKIRYTGEYNDRDILPLLKSSVKSLCLLCSSSWSVLLYEKVTSLQNLEAINISRFKMSHEQLTLLYDYISQRQCMRDIDLCNLHCTDYKKYSCTGCCLNLSNHSKLRKIKLESIPVSELNINMSSLEECELRRLFNPDLVLRFINCVPADSKVNRFMCINLKSSAAHETIQQTLPLLVHVERVKLWVINLGNRNLLSTEMVNIKWINLLGVTMPASVVRGIVTVLQQLTQTVTVDIRGCNITPESEFVTVKEEIKQSPKFRVSEDSGYRRYLMFETIKDGD